MANAPQKTQDNIVIASAARTPVGSFNGALASLSAHELGRIAIKAAVERAGIAAGDVGEVIMGPVSYTHLTLPTIYSV